ncbi:PREDICTED: uncharacterized protein LOC105456839 isoform X2 [Wasmannia auropunctata]|uniref:uncharacterized protein LOC105456839 isoform X2 n=1 Tax=Wasmannia auropunctata TaxID=64793 RepID=UPI0005F04C78|nr:PREDICTED: uncharacterized protein LOC105456839 isoform X2 [Wasmannia auropunctata]
MSCTSSRKFRKLECPTRDESPTRSEIQLRLGTSLAQVLLDYSHPEAVKLLDSIPAKLSRESCCVSCCASRNSQSKADATGSWAGKHEIVRTDLHSDILALGEEEMKKFQMEVEATTQKRLRDEFADECRKLEAEKRFTIGRNAEELHARYEEFFKSAQEELKEKLQIELADTSAIRDKELQKAVVKARIDTTHDVLRKIRPQVNWVVTSLCNEFEQIRRAEREKTIADFNKIIRKQHLELDARIREIEREKIEELHIQRRELYVQNAMNIIFTFCMERLRSNSQLQTMHKHFECIKYRNCETNGSTKSYRVDHCYERTDVRSCRRDVFCSI